MKLITAILFTCLAMEMSGQSNEATKPLTYEESKAANRPPAPEAAKAMRSWAAEATKHRVLMISRGFTDPQAIRDSVVEIVQAEERQLRVALKAAGWTEKEVETTVAKFKETFLSLAEIEDQVAQHNR